MSILKCVTAASGNQMLLGVKDPSNEMYGAPTAYYGDTSSASASSPAVPPKPSVHVLERVANMEVMVVRFIAENSLSFSLSGKLIGLAKELAKDEPALMKLNMHRTTASYKLTHGLGRTFPDQLTSNLKTTPFSQHLQIPCVHCLLLQFRRKKHRCRASRVYRCPLIYQ